MIPSLYNDQLLISDTHVNLDFLALPEQTYQSCSPVKHLNYEITVHLMKILIQNHIKSILILNDKMINGLKFIYLLIVNED